MRRTTTRLPIILLALFFLSSFTTAPFAAQIINYYPYAFIDNEGLQSPGNLTGNPLNFCFGVIHVLPNGLNGTTASARHLATGTEIPLPNWAIDGRPGLFATEMPFTQAVASPWEITLRNEDDVKIAETPDRTGAQKMEFVKNLSISGPGNAPTVTWELPSVGSPVNMVRYELWDWDTNTIISGESSVPIGASATHLNIVGLELGTQYAIRIMPTLTDQSGTISRSSNWLAWEASNGVAEGEVLQLTTGSPAGVSQTIDIPDISFNVEFDYKFITTTGYLEVFIDGMLIGTRLEAPSSLGDGFYRAIFEVEDPTLLGLLDVSSLFMLDGPTGSYPYR